MVMNPDTPQGQQQDVLLKQVLSALQILALDYNRFGNDLAVIGEAPDWVEQEFEFVCPSQGFFSADVFSPFLANFLVDAKDFWKESSTQAFCSGIWSEPRFSGREIHLEAIALSLEGRQLILIRSVELDSSEKFKWLQTARQEQLNIISERKVIEAKILEATFYDSLTDLPNRSFFIAKLEALFEEKQWSEDRQFAIVILNIDRFQQVNNSLGPAEGDQILVTVASRIRACLRKHDIPARFGGDEFGILVSHIEREQDIVTLVKRLLASIHEPFIVKGQKTYFTASAGIAIQEPWYQQSKDLLRDAGLAMQQAQSFGNGRYAIFRREMRSRAFELWSLESDLHHAIERGELQLWYQPIVNLNTHKIESFEALIRWLHPSLGWVSPTKFIPLAEETDLILTLDSWVLNTACQAVKQWQMATGQDIRVNINISPQHFTRGDLLIEVQKAISESQISPQSIQLEITESLLLDDTKVAIDTLNQLKVLGIEVAIDDFGTGYASLSYLHDLPLDKLKIDGYFIEMMENSGAEIVNTVISLAHKLGFSVTAERVETIKQYQTLQGLGCDTVQGYLFSKPVLSLDAQSLINAEFVISGQSSDDTPTT